MSSYRPLVLVDCDGVLADFVGAFLGTVNYQLGTEYQREQVTTFGFDTLPGWTANAPFAWSLARHVGFCRDIPPLPGAVEGFRALREIVDVEICTSPMYGAPHWVHERDVWLETHFDISHKHIHHVRKKHRMDAAVLLDDSGENLDLWAQHRPDSLALMWDATYNRSFKHERVSSWDTVIEIVKARVA